MSAGLLGFGTKIQESVYLCSTLARPGIVCQAHADGLQNQLDKRGQSSRLPGVFQMRRAGGDLGPGEVSKTLDFGVV